MKNNIQCSMVLVTSLLKMGF